MAIDLYANFERSKNNPLFYRKTAFGKYPVSVRVVDLDEPNADLTTVFYVESSLNGAPFVQFLPNSSNLFQHQLLFDSSVPALCSIRINIKDVSQTTTLETLTISCKFVDSLPIANFSLWPLYVPYRDPGTGNVLTKTLDGLNYVTESSGTSFYGEGHTETFYLSCWNITVSEKTVWFVGTPSSILIDKSRSSVPLSPEDSVLSVNAGPFLNSAVVDISTTPLQHEDLPVSLFIYDDIDVTKNSPIITYNDVDGSPSYYSYFYSTEDPFGNPNPQNTYLRDTIHILPYTTPGAAMLSGDLTENPLFLPINSTTRTFKTEIAFDPIPTTTTPVDISFKGSFWNVIARSFVGGWGDKQDAFTETGFLPAVNIHAFTLKYDVNNNGILDYFTAASNADTTITAYSTAVRELHINTAPNDWLPRTVYDVQEVSTVVKPIPFGNKIYTPNYYNLKESDVRFEFLINFEQTRYNIKEITFFSESAYNSYKTNNSVVGFLRFKKSGLASITVTIITEDTVTGLTQTYQTNFPNFLEIIDYYDDVKPDNYNSDASLYSSLELACPQLSPNEWCTQTAINSKIEIIYNVLQTVQDYSYKYVPAFCLYGWIGLMHSSQLVWQEAECPPAEEQTVMWMALECELESCRSALIDYSPRTWDANICPDPDNCSGAHCAIWNWKNQKGKFTDQCITWKDAVCDTEESKGGQFGASWRNNTPCETDSELNCVKSTWHICTIDPEYFPINNCNKVSTRCSFVGIAANHIPHDTLVLAYSTELHLVSTDYGMTKLDLVKLSNLTTRFQNIVGLSISPYNQLFVLDSTLSQVSVFRFSTENKLEFVNSWGKFGFKDSVNGLNKPRDIHVDQHNTVLIADTGNKCIKKFAFNGRNLGIISNSKFENDPPKSVCVDSSNNIHVLLSSSVLVLNYDGYVLFEYKLADDVRIPIKINNNYNRECVYITFGTGIAKYFKNGEFAHFVTNNHRCDNGTILASITTTTTDKYRNLYATAGERMFKFGDRMRVQQLTSGSALSIDWSSKKNILLEKNEYIQPWVYLKLFHKIWDDIEIVRNSLYYQTGECKNYIPAVWEKEDLTIGQNELVSNAVVNRLLCQLWDNLLGVLKYFEPNCGTKLTEDTQLETCCKNRLTCNPIPQYQEEVIPEVEQTCDRHIRYEGVVSYPKVETFELGVMSLGLVSLVVNPFDVPDRYIVEYNGSVVIDTGYLGDSTLYGHGGWLRSSFTNRLNGLKDPITNNIYPFVNAKHALDNYPDVTDIAAPTTYQFNKNALTSTATLSVYAPMLNTLWEAYMSCPGQQPIPTPTQDPTPTPTQDPTPTPTQDPTPTPTQDPTPTPTQDPTPTPTQDPTPTPTQPTPTPTPTQPTPTPTPTQPTPTPTPTQPTPTPTPTAAPVRCMPCLSTEPPLTQATTTRQGPILYTSINGVTQNRYVYEGNYVALLIPETYAAGSAQETSVFNAVLQLDEMYRWFARITQDEPNSNPGFEFNGKTTIAANFATCGYACGWPGGKGIEIGDGLAWPEVRADILAGKMSPALPYEFGRNFWHWPDYEDRIEYVAPDWTDIATGYAVFNRLVLFDKTGIQPGNFNGIPYNTFYNGIRHLLVTYLGTSTYNWNNTLRNGSSVPSSVYAFGATDLFASFCLDLSARFGCEFVDNIWPTINTMPVRNTTQDAVDNFVHASCKVTCTDLRDLFVYYRWPISAATNAAIGAEAAANSWRSYDPVQTYEYNATNFVLEI